MQAACAGRAEEAAAAAAAAAGGGGRAGGKCRAGGGERTVNLVRPEEEDPTQQDVRHAARIGLRAQAKSTKCCLAASRTGIQAQPPVTNT